MNSSEFEWTGLFPFSFILRECIGASLLLCLLFSGCAVVGVNNYQTAETLGKGKLKAGGAIEFGRKMDAGIDITGGDIEFKDEGLGDYLFPLIEVTVQYGITRSTDIGLTVTQSFGPSGSKAIHLKQGLVHTPENFAVAVMLGGGLFGSDTESSGSELFSSQRYEEENTFQGHFFEIPFIISKRWTIFAIHMTPKYMYHHLKVSTDYKEFHSSGGSLAAHITDEETFEFSTIGAAVGFSLISEPAQFTPEVSILRVKNLPENSYRWIAYPGVGLYIMF